MYYEDKQRLLKEEREAPKSIDSLLTSGVLSSIKLPETKPTNRQTMTDKETIYNLQEENRALKLRLSNAVIEFKKIRAELAELKATPRTTESKPKKQKTNEATDIAISIYDAYPKKIDKKRAMQSINKAIIDMKRNGGTAENLLETVKQYRREVERHGLNPRHEKWASIPHPSTWFNQGRYENDPAEWTALFREGKHTDIEKPQEVEQEPKFWRKVLKHMYPSSDPSRMLWPHFNVNHPDTAQEVKDKYNLITKELNL